MGLAERTVRTYAGDSVPRQMGAAAGLVVMGGPMGVYEQDRHPHLGDELALIGDALERQVPVLGICLGSQLLAAALGSRVYPGPAKELGWYQLEWLPDAARDPVFHRVASDAIDRFPLAWRPVRSPARRAGAGPLRDDTRASVRIRLAGLWSAVSSDPRPLLKTIVTAFADEARAAGRDPTAILAEGDTFLSALSRTAASVFGTWAALLSGSEEHAAPSR